MGAFNIQALPESGNGSGAPVSICFATATLFHILGVQPRFGRLFRPEEERPSRERPTVLTGAYYERRFHHDPKVLGRRIILDGVAYTLIGILPPDFYMPESFFNDSQPDVFVPLPESWPQLIVVARMRRGLSLAQARAEMEGIAGRLKQADRDIANRVALPFSRSRSRGRMPICATPCMSYSGP